MFQFPRLAFVSYVFRNKYLLLISASPNPGRDPEFRITDIEGGFPHSEIHGSMPVRGSPGLIAAYHVLHRLSAPRHPPDTLKTLDCSHYQRAPFSRLSSKTQPSFDGLFQKNPLPIRLGSLRTLPLVRGFGRRWLYPNDRQAIVREKTSFASNTSGSLSGQA